MVVARSPRPPPCGPVILQRLPRKKCLYLATLDLDLFFNTIQACRSKETFFCTPFVARILTPRSAKSGCGLVLECRCYKIVDPKKPFFGYVRKRIWPKTVKAFTVCSDPQLRGRISRKGAHAVRESRERRDKIVPKHSPGNSKNAIWMLAWYLLNFLSRIACCSRESISAWPEGFRQKQPKRKKNMFFVSEIFFQKWVRIP